jgi:hypothetical protein
MVLLRSDGVGDGPRRTFSRADRSRCRRPRRRGCRRSSRSPRGRGFSRCGRCRARHPRRLRSGSSSSLRLVGGGGSHPCGSSPAPSPARVVVWTCMAVSLPKGVMNGALSRSGPSRRRRRRGRGSSSSSCFRVARPAQGRPFGSISPPWPAGTPLRMLIVRSVRRFVLCQPLGSMELPAPVGSMQEPVPARVCVWVLIGRLRSAVWVDSAADAGAELRVRAHLILPCQPPPLGSMPQPLPARSRVDVLICLLPRQPLSSILAPAPARTRVWMLIVRLPCWGSWMRRAPRASRGGPAPLARASFSSTPGVRWTCALCDGPRAAHFEVPGRGTSGWRPPATAKASHAEPRSRREPGEGLRVSAALREMLLTRPDSPGELADRVSAVRVDEDALARGHVRGGGHLRAPIGG